MWKSRDNEWTCSNALVESSRYEYYTIRGKDLREEWMGGYLAYWDPGVGADGADETHVSLQETEEDVD